MPTRIGLIAGRHDLKANDGEPITDFIFGKIDDVHDFKRMENTAFEYLIKAKATELELYVTGLTPATTSTITNRNSGKRHVGKFFLGWQPQ